MIKIVVNNQIVGTRDLEQFEFRSNFGDRISNAELNFDSLTIVAPWDKIIHEWVAQYGTQVGIPTTVNFGTLNLDCYVDLSEFYDVKDREVTVRLKKRKGLDSFFEYADGMTFDMLAKLGVQFENRPAKYLIIRDNQVETGLTLFLAILFNVVSIAEYTRDQAHQNADSASVAGYDFVNAAAVEAANIMRIVANAVYLAALVAGLIVLVLRFIELLFPKVRYFNSCTFYDLIKKGVEYKGYTLSSTLLESIKNITVIPIPTTDLQHESIFDFIENLRQFNFNTIYPTAADSVSTLGLAIKSIETLFNAETRVSNGVVKIETLSYFESLANGEFIEAFNIQEETQSIKKYNTNEAYLRYYLHFNPDYSDSHTLNTLQNTRVEFGIQNTNQLDQDLNLLKGLYDANFPFSRGIVKTNLTWVENLALQFFTKAQELTKNSANIILQNRLNVLQISQQYFANTKIYSSDLSGSWTPEIAAVFPLNLWNNYHRSQVIDVNGWEIYDNMPMTMDLTKFQNLFDNNYMYINGTVCRILNVVWNPYYSTGLVSYKKKSNYMLDKISIFAL